MNIAVIILLVLMLAMMYRQYQHAVLYREDSKARLFTNCFTLLKNAKQQLDRANLPIIKGEFNGYNVSLSIVEDTLGWRKVPPLWLLVKFEANAQVAGTLDYIVRPSNNEFYSPAWQWNGNLEIPEKWPQHAILKFKNESVDVNLIDPFIPMLFKDHNTKELLITPNMTRLTYMVKQAERGEYLIMRNAIYDNSPISPNVVSNLLNQMLVIQKQLENNQLSLINKAA